MLLAMLHQVFKTGDGAKRLGFQGWKEGTCKFPGYEQIGIRKNLLKQLKYYKLKTKILEHRFIIQLNKSGNSEIIGPECLSAWILKPRKRVDSR